MSEIEALIRALDTSNTAAQRRAGNQLLAAGSQSLPALVAALSDPSPQVRKAAAFLLGTYKGASAAVDALTLAVVGDSEPKVRKNAAIALGKSGAEQAVAALAQALASEQIGWVRTSIILALGAISGDAACAALQTVTPQDAAEHEALRKALDRCIPREQSISWRQTATGLTLLLSAPPGLEELAIGEAAARGIAGLELYGDGLLRCAPGTAPWQPLPALRCIDELLIDGGRGAAITTDHPDACSASVARLLASSPVIATIRTWLDTPADELRYRFSFTQRIRREVLRAAISAARAVLDPQQLIDSPSNYAIELIVDAPSGQLLIKPSFIDDSRFAYRHADVGAAINPVVAACLARLVRTTEAGTIFDPTCGSGTLLIERALLDPATRLLGRDISPTAVAAAATNVRAAGLVDRIQIGRGDARDSTAWPQCDEVIANLPFGLRTRHGESDLDQLYAQIVTHTAHRLNSGGRAVFYTAARHLIEPHLARQRNRLRHERTLQVWSGGILIFIYVLRGR